MRNVAGIRSPTDSNRQIIIIIVAAAALISTSPCINYLYEIYLLTDFMLNKHFTLSQYG